MKHFPIFLVLILAAFSCVGMTVGDPGCEHWENPLGVDVAQPCLSWILKSSRRGDRQTAYQILAASTRSRLNKDTGDLWDSGKVVSDDTIQISYAGKPLKSSQQIFWKVRVWDAHGQVSGWSPTATWTMGLLAESDWKANGLPRRRMHQAFVSSRVQGEKADCVGLSFTSADSANMNFPPTEKKPATLCLRQAGRNTIKPASMIRWI